MTRAHRLAIWLASDLVQIVANAALGAAFLALIPVALVTGLKRSVPFVVFLSLWALVAAHWSGALAAWAAQRAVPDPSAAEPSTQSPSTPA